MISRTWIKPAEYKLPDGYSLGWSHEGTLHIYNDADQPCMLKDGAIRGKEGGQPRLYDFGRNMGRLSATFHLEKVRDLTFEEAERINLGSMIRKTRDTSGQGKPETDKGQEAQAPDLEPDEEPEP